MMLINLQKTFRFNNEEKAYDVDYTFINESNLGGSKDSLSLLLHISINAAEKKTYKISKPASTLYQSNELIEGMIRHETLSFYN